jgi:ABC-type transporter Mla subunit MlaD
MSKEANYFRIGVFIIGAAVILAVGLVTFGMGQFFRPKIYFETYVDGSVQGIDIGSPVKFRGVTIGKVIYIGFTFTDYPLADRTQMLNYVLMLLEIEREVFPGMFEENLAPVLKRAVERGLRIQNEPQGITGLNYLEIDYVDPKRFVAMEVPWEPRHYYIPSAPGELTSLLDSVNSIMRQIEDLNIQGIREELMVLIKNMNEAVTGAQIEKLSADAQKLIADFTAAIESAKLGELSRDASVLMTDIAKSNDELRRILGNLEPASRLNADEVAATLSNLRSISDNLRRLSADLERDPSRLIWSRPAKPATVFDEQPGRKPARKAQ